MDIRKLPKGSIASRLNFSIEPDEIGDMRNLKHKDNTFKIVVMDPPHMESLGDNSWMAIKYGKVTQNWRSTITRGFKEGMRVLQQFGILIFKRNESEIPLIEVLKLFPVKPSLGQRTGKNNKTVRLIFIKS